MRVQIFDVNNFVLRDTSHTTHGGLKGRSQVRATFERVQNSVDLHIFVRDGRGSRARRKAIYPEYKAKRVPKTEDKMAGIDLFFEIMKLSKAVTVDCPGWEADDVIGTIAQKLLPDDEIVIHTNDSDFGQLASSRVSIPRMKQCAPAEYVPLYKALVGDSTDNIPGCKGFGPSAWEAAQPYWADIKAAFDAKDASLLPVTFRLGRNFDFDRLLGFYTITQMFSVPLDEVRAGMAPGSNQPDVAARVLQEYFL